MARSRALFALAVAALPVVACGQITGLTDDYTYDLGSTDGGAANEGGGGDAVADVIADVTTDGSDSGRTCTDAQKNLALTSMAGMKDEACKFCLAAQCCTVVQPCTTQATGCRATLACHLDCSEKVNPQPCFNAQCSNATAAEFQAVRSCATSFCSKDCVL